MKKFLAIFSFSIVCLVLAFGLHTADAGKPVPPTERQVRVMATNDLGMHCVCMGAETFLLLPPFNTLRAQVFEKTSRSPLVLSDPNDITVKYNIVENTDDNLKADPYYANWLVNSKKLFPGFDPIRPDGKIQGLTGATLDGVMHAKPEGWWEVVGVPAYPDVSNNSSAADKVMTDPLGGLNRNPYLTANIQVIENATGKLLAETNTVAPAAFGGCCACHLDLAASYGYTNPTPRDSFNVMGMLHERDSGINIAQIDPDGDGIGGPIRCSQCHLDPAMGESTPPGYPGLATSQYTFSDVVHRWHVQNSTVLTYDPDLANNCYTCHPGNNVNCYRGHHTNKSLDGVNPVWCSDCHGDLNQRVAEGQLLNPWSDATLPKCGDCHQGIGEGGGYLNMGIFGKFLNSMGHKSDKVLCSTCHGAPHALYPSTLAKDNAQNVSLQNDTRPIGVCDTCHTGKSTTYGVPPH